MLIEPVLPLSTYQYYNSPRAENSEAYANVNAEDDEARFGIAAIVDLSVEAQAILNSNNN